MTKRKPKAEPPDPQEYIKRLVATAPPLSEEQRAALRMLLSPVLDRLLHEETVTDDN
jgi:hypothetical protein